MITAAGFLSGIGSMLIGARAAGFKVIYNIEDRKKMLPSTFERNFKGAKFFSSMIDAQMDPIVQGQVDLLMGHPPCGNFSKMADSAKWAINDMTEKRANPGRIPDFVQAIQTLGPRFFVMENLVKSEKAYPFSNYHEKLGKWYDISCNFISNWDYGNSQKFKKRLFIIGSLKEEQFTFTPIEKSKEGSTVEIVIGDLPWWDDLPEINHDHVNPEQDCGQHWGYTPSGKRIKKTFADVIKIMKNQKPGKAPTYKNLEGKTKVKIGMVKLYWEKHSHTMTGGAWGRATLKFHPHTGQPLTIREILRIQGAPDDFVLDGDRFEQLLQAGKFIAVEFCEYVAKQIINHIKGNKRPFPND